MITFRFPPVPQGLIWTGCLALYANNPASVFNTKFIDGVRWSLTRNSTPVIAYTGEAVVYDVQAVGQEVLTLTGHNVPIGTSVTATWFGFSDDAGDAPAVYPRLYVTPPPYVEVYTSTPGAPLDVVQVPDPSTLQVAYGFNGTPGTTIDIIPAGQAVGYKIWSATLNATGTNQATAAGSFPLLVKLQKSTGDAVMVLEPMTVQASTQTATASQNLYGFETGVGTGLQLNVGTYGGTAARANATVLVSSYV